MEVENTVIGPPTSLVSVSITLNVTFLCIVVTIELDTYQSLSINIAPTRLARKPMAPDIFTTMTREIKLGVPIVDLELLSNTDTTLQLQH